MSSETNLEVKGNIFDHPLAELLAEISQSNLSGSLRLAHAEQKIIIYFDGGEVVFAVSNARAHRLFFLLLNDGKITTEQLGKIPNFSNDQELKINLVRNNILTLKEINNFFPVQVNRILQSALDWSEGSWVFSPLIRIKSDIRVAVDVTDMLFAQARIMPPEKVVRRFKSFQELFSVKHDLPAQINLLPQESFVFSRMGSASHPIEEVVFLSGLSEIETLKTLYILWLGGFLVRRKWNSAFSSESLSAIRSARFELKSKAYVPSPTGKKTVEEKSPVEKPEDKKPEDKKPEDKKPEITLDDYLERTEEANTFYELLDVTSDAVESEIKSAYFQLAKRFHPDLFYRRVADDLHRRIQMAFTELAHAYETLRNKDSREVYDFKLRKEIANLSKRPDKKNEPQTPLQMMEEQAAENFEQGFNLIMEEEYEEALPFLARAVHLIGGNARYRAYYGKALSADEKTYRQAEAELQAALRIEPDNLDYRLMIAELFINIGLSKRAEGELRRILQKAPNNYEAKSLLDSLQGK